MHSTPAARAESTTLAQPLSAADMLPFYEAQDAVTSVPASNPPATIPAPTADALRSAGDFEISFSPALWMSRVRADTSLNGPTFTVDDQLGLNGYEATFNGELSASWGLFYKVMLTGWFFSTDAATSATAAGAFGAVNIAVGDRLSNRFSAAGAGGEFDVTLWQPFADQQFPWASKVVNAKNTASDGWYKADLRIKAIGAVRWYSAQLSVNDLTAGTSASWSMDAVMPGLGGGFEIDFNMADHVSWLDSIRLEASGLMGTNFTNEQYFLAARAGLSFMFTRNCGVEFGYRLEDFKLNNNSAIFDGGVQGLFVGMNVKF